MDQGGEKSIVKVENVPGLSGKHIRKILERSSGGSNRKAESMP